MSPSIQQPKRLSTPQNQKFHASLILHREVATLELEVNQHGAM